MSKRKQRKKPNFHSDLIMDLNVMPFVDIFSLLCTFLLFTAVFISIGMHTVQIPFFAASSEISSAPNKPELKLKLNIFTNILKLEASGGSLPKSGVSFDYENTPQGLQTLYEKLVEIKQANPTEEKITIFTDEDLTYERLIQVFDAVRISRNLNQQNQNNSKTSESYAKNLFPKVILGDVVP